MHIYVTTERTCAINLLDHYENVMPYSNFKSSITVYTIKLWIVYLKHFFSFPSDTALCIELCRTLYQKSTRKGPVFYTSSCLHISCINNEMLVDCPLRASQVQFDTELFFFVCFP